MDEEGGDWVFLPALSGAKCLDITRGLVGEVVDAHILHAFNLHVDLSEHCHSLQLSDVNCWSFRAV